MEGLWRLARCRPHPRFKNLQAQTLTPERPIMPLLERTKVYKYVWSRPCTKIAAELGISSSALKRICTEMDIPTPVAGNWTRVQCGKTVSKDPLPKAKKETKLIWDVDLENSKRQKTERVWKEKPVHRFG
jgi:hypothetical protein